MADEGAVHDGHALVGRYAGERGDRVLGTDGGADVEAEGAQLVSER
ncbi:hypothetical protein OG625_06390 [Streptomyces sp. NBC_01351]|nr:hypothetical protein [Streptomyces sp. NBC_01351]